MKFSILIAETNRVDYAIHIYGPSPSVAVGDLIGAMGRWHEINDEMVFNAINICKVFSLSPSTPGLELRFQDACRTRECASLSGVVERSSARWPPFIFLYVKTSRFASIRILSLSLSLAAHPKMSEVPPVGTTDFSLPKIHSFNDTLTFGPFEPPTFRNALAYLQLWPDTGEKTAKPLGKPWMVSVVYLRTV